jgi:hypothetical protein
MPMGSYLVAPLCMVATLAATTVTASGPSHLVGSGAIEHCGTNDGVSISCRDDEGIQLRFDRSNAESALTIDFVLRGKDLPHAHRVVEIYVTARRSSTRALSAVTFQRDHRPYPLATNVDSRGVVKSVMPLESFVELVLSSPLQGSAFGDRFVATDRQMLALRLAVGRWAAYAPPAK